MLWYRLVYNTLQHTTPRCNILEFYLCLRQHMTSLHCCGTVFFTSHCNILQHTATRWILVVSAPAQDLASMLWYCLVYNTLQHTATHCNTLEFYLCLRQHKNSLQCFRTAFFTTHCNKLQHAATRWNSTCVCTRTRPRSNALALPSLQHTATYCNIPQHTATYCNTLKFYLCLRQHKTSLQCFGTASF